MDISIGLPQIFSKIQGKFCTFIKKIIHLKMIFFLEISSLSFDLKDDGEGVKYAHVNVFENQSQPSPPTKTNRHLKHLFLMICSGEHQMHTDLFWRSITLKLRRTYVVLVVLCWFSTASKNLCQKSKSHIFVIMKSGFKC